MKQSIYIDKLFNIPFEQYQIFNENTKIKFFSKNKNPIVNSPKEDVQHTKAYARFKEISLPKPRLRLTHSLKKSLINRKSQRSNKKKKLSSIDISTLLYYSGGIIKSPTNKYHRFYPSAGAKYPLEIYIWLLNSSYPSGIYHYYPKNHSLEQILPLMKIENNKEITDCFNQEWIQSSNAVIIISAIFSKTTTKYQNRGYRHVLIEAGHLGQNIYLLSSAMNLGCCAIGGFIDQKLNNLLDIDGTIESSIYSFALG